MNNQELFCKPCNLRFATLLVLKTHASILHGKFASGPRKSEEKSKLMLVSLIQDGEEKFSCFICNASFALQKHLVNHVFSNHKEKKLYSCSALNCGASFERNTTLTNHIRVVHEGKRRKTTTI